MKKVLSMFLALIFLLIMSSQIQVLAKSEYPKEKIERLVALGILNDLSDVEYDSKEQVTQKSFYSAIYGIMSNEKNSDENIVNVLGANGIDVNKAFLREKLTRADALIIVAKVRGYSFLLQNTDLSKIATQMGVSKYLAGETNGYLTIGEMINLIYETAFGDMQISSIKMESGSIVYDVNNDISALNYYRNIYELKGIVNKNQYVSIIDNNPAREEYVEIEDIKVAVGNTDAADYVGIKVRALVQYDEDKDNAVLLYIAADENATSVITIESQDIIDIDDEIKKITYEVNDRTKTAKISAIVKVIYNGKIYSGYTKYDLMPEVGNITIIDTNRDNEIDVIKISSYETILVDYVSQNSGLIASKYNSPKTYKVDDDKDVLIKKDGVEVGVKDIGTGNIICLMRSKETDEEPVRIYVSDQQVTGTITSINYEECILVADGKEYTISKAFKSAIDDTALTFVQELDIGKNYCLYLDCFGNVAYAVSTEGTQYVYARKLWQDRKADEYGVTALTTEGEWKKIKFGKKVLIDHNGSRYRADEAYSLLGGNVGFSDQLLRIELNKDGEIKSIETATTVTKEDKTKFTKYTMPSVKIYSRDAMTFGNEIHGTANTKVFILPSDSDELEEKSYVTGMSYFKLDSRYKVEAYDIDKFYTTPIIVYRSDDSVADSSMTIVKKTWTALIDDEVKTVMKVLRDGTEQDLVVSSNCTMPTLNVGDVVVTAQDTIGEVSYIEVKHNISSSITKQYPDMSDPASIHKSEVIAKGTITAIGAEEGMFLADCGTYEARLRVLGSSRIYLYDGKEMKNDKVKAVGLSDLQVGDNVFMHIGWTKLVVLYAMRNVD